MIQKHPDSDICTLKWEIFCLRCFFCFYIYSTYIWQSLPKKVRYCISEVTSHICTILSGFDHLYRWIKLTNMVLFGTVSFEIQYPTFFWLPKILYIPNMLNHWTINILGRYTLAGNKEHILGYFHEVWGLWA